MIDRRRIGRWHVGQLVMVWLGVLLGTAALGIGALVASESADRIADAHAAAVRDSVVRTDPARMRAVRDTLAAMSGRNEPEWRIDAAMRDLGALSREAYRPTPGEVRTVVLRRLATWLLAAGAPALLVFAVWATWTWFGARAAPLPRSAAD